MGQGKLKKGTFKRSAEFFATLELNEVGFFGSMPFYLFMVLFVWALGMSDLAYSLFVAFIIASILVIIIRGVHYKERPDQSGYNNWVEKIYSASFPSMHAIRATMLFTIFFLHFQSIGLFVLMFITMLLVGVNRVFTKRHYEADVIFGVIIGLFLGYIVFINF